MFDNLEYGYSTSEESTIRRFIDKTQASKKHKKIKINGVSINRRCHQLFDDKYKLLKRAQV